MKASDNQRKLFYVAIVVVSLVATYYLTQPADDSKYGDVSVQEARDLIESIPDLVILDVRTVSEYDDEHIEGAVLIPVQELVDRLDELSTSDELIVYCRSGNRSSTAVQILKDNDFVKIYHMYEGIIGWIDAGYPTV